MQKIYLSLLLLLICALPALAQSDEEYIKPSRPGVADPAEIQESGVLQLEYGYSALYHSDRLRIQRNAPLSLRFAATKFWLISIDADTVISEVGRDHQRRTSFGDTGLGTQMVLLSEGEKRPAFALAWGIKFPTGPESKDLSSGRIDYKMVGLLSKKLGKQDIDFNLAYLNIGRAERSGRESGIQAALSISRELSKYFGFEGEISGQSHDQLFPPGVFGMIAAKYQVDRRLIFDSGVRIGLSHGTPRIGVFAGLTVGVANLFK